METPSEYRKTADQITKAWWDHLVNLNEIDISVEDVDPEEWAWLDNAIADALALAAELATARERERCAKIAELYNDHDEFESICYLIARDIRANRMNQMSEAEKGD